MRALLTCDTALAHAVVAEDDRIDACYAESYQALLSVLALQAPVAGDLRLVVALLHAIRSIERMGDQCVTIAKLALREAPVGASDAPLGERIARMAQIVGGEVAQAKEAFAARSAPLAESLVERDHEVNLLNREIFRRAVELGADPVLRESAMRMTLVARGLERIGDSAVDIGEQAAYVVTGRFREFSDASHAPAG
jgi:phosphate transport system protein